MDSQKPAPEIKTDKLAVKIRKRALLERKELWVSIIVTVVYVCWRWELFG